MTTRVLMLVLASDDMPIYRDLQVLWRNYMKSNRQIDCYFYKGDPNLDVDAKLDGDTLWIRIEDQYSNIYEKTLRAFDFFAEKFEQYSFIYRTNLSSFIDLDTYMRYCSTIPRSRFVSGVIGNYQDFTFPSGCGFTMTPDLVVELIKEKPQLLMNDDVTIGKWLCTKHIPIHPVGRVDFTNDTTSLLELLPINNIFHYRVKNSDRKLDIVIYSKLLKKCALYKNIGFIRSSRPMI